MPLLQYAPPIPKTRVLSDSEDRSPAAVAINGLALRTALTATAARQKAASKAEVRGCDVQCRDEHFAVPR